MAFHSACRKRSVLSWDSKTGGNLPQLSSAIAGELGHPTDPRSSATVVYALMIFMG